MDSKRCSRCREAKPLAGFSNDARRGDGLNVYCRECVAAKYLALAERRRSSPRPVVTEKRCTACKAVKPISDFAGRSASEDGYFYQCRPCQAVQKAASFQRNYQHEKERMTRRNTAHAEGVRVFLANLKHERGCIECGERHPACLDFHHREGTVKLAEVSRLVGMMIPRARLLAEVDKCEVICANCHRKRHAKTFRYMKRWTEEGLLTSSVQSESI